MAPSDYPTICGAMSVTDVAELAGVSEDSVGQYYRKGLAGMPEPALVVKGSPIWEYKAIAEWIETRPGRGRPRKS